MDILLVTAFFDIGRENSGVPGMNRSNKKYFDYFKTWAGIYNQLIVYTQPEFVDEIEQIRNSFGMKERTMVIPLSNIAQIEPEIYQRMREIELYGDWHKLRMSTVAMSNKAEYNYIMLMKYWCLYDAVKKTGFSESVAWIDFGFNHGDACYYDPNDFKFEWHPEISSGIHLYALNDPMKRNAMGTLLLQSDCIMGCLVVMTAEYCAKLWSYTKDAMQALLMLEAMDDDQQLLIMAYKCHSEDFHIHYSNWFLPIKENGAQHLKVREDYGKTKKIPIMLRVKNLIARICFVLLRDYSHVTPHDFGKRMEKYAKEHR